MSHGFLLDSGLKADNLPVGPVISVPLLVRFTVQDRRWTIQGGRFYHVPSKRTAPVLIASGELDAWAVRSDFLRATTEKDFLAFLRRTGVFWHGNESGVITLKHLKAFQRAVMYLLNTEPSKWRPLASVFPSVEIIQAILRFREHTIAFKWAPQAHAAVINTDATLGALVASVYIDHLRGAKFAFCARPDCRKQYLIESKHKRKYCTPYCAHFEAVRRSRSAALANKKTQAI